MSADNTIVILSLKDQHRVIHAQAVENIYFTYIPKDENSAHDYSFARIFQYFLDGNTSRTVEEAEKHARKLEEKIGYVEYGIKHIQINKTWLDITKKAREEILEEKKYILKHSDYDSHLKLQVVEELNILYGNVLKEIVKEKYVKQ